jgi:glycosyl transferase, family 25
MQAAFVERMLQHVPGMDLSTDGDFSQKAGIDLPIVVINLPHRTDRWRTLQQRMSAAGLDRLIRAPAVEGAGLADVTIAALLGSPADGIDEAPRSHLSLTRPAVGCFLSHLAIWRWMIAKDLPRLLVLEDDAAPAPNYSAARLRGVLASLPNEAGLTFFGRIIMHGLAERPAGSDLARMYYFNGTFAYLITPKAARFLLQRLFPLQAHIDHQMSRVLIEQRQVFPAYNIEPPFFEPDWSQRSDCYVPLADDSIADRELGQLFEAARQSLLAEGRPLLAIP